MCGIAGIAWSDHRRRSPAGLVERMTRVLAHRGPDGEGFREGSGFSLGHRRLSVIDVACGAQPLTNEEESVWITYNGEIYNFPELRAELLAKGHRFRTSSDTEVIVHLYEEHGVELVERLRGMFAFGLWDDRRRRLFLARDRLGVKPLVYRLDQDGLRFASELKSLLVEPGAPRRLDPRSLDLYLAYQYVPHPRTILEGYSKLPPGCLAVYEGGKLEIVRYWRPPYEREQALPEEEFVRRLRETLTDAVRARLQSEVPLGAFLSGGIDSTIVAGLMREVTRGPVKTFSIGFSVKEFDESNYARHAAQWLGTDHEEFFVEPDAAEVLPLLAWHYDEPFADSSAIPTYYVSRMTRRKVTVALTGDGGDEHFAGYLRYRAVQLGDRIDKMPGLVRRGLTSKLWQRIPASVRQRSFRRRLKRLLLLLGERPQTRYREWISIFGDGLRRELYTPEFRQQLADHSAADWLDRYYAELPGRDFVTRTMYVDLCTYLPCDILTKVDIASMAVSLECRSPFLDRDVAALAGCMPLSLKLSGGVSKRILKRAFADLLPPTIRRRPKMGFGVPIDRWLRGELSPLLDETVLSRRFRERGWFDPAVVERLAGEHRSKRWDHSYRLWALLMLELWARTYLDGEADESPPAVREGSVLTR